ARNPPYREARDSAAVASGGSDIEVRRERAEDRQVPDALGANRLLSARADGARAVLQVHRPPLSGDHDRRPAAGVIAASVFGGLLRQGLARQGDDRHSGQHGGAANGAAGHPHSVSPCSPALLLLFGIWAAGSGSPAWRRVYV